MITRLKTAMLCIALFCCMGNTPAFSFDSAQEYRTLPSIFDELNRGSELLQVTIRTDLVELIDNRRNKEYLPAELVFVDEFGMEVSWDVSLKARGRYRRRVCDFPPFKVKFDRPTLAVKGYDQVYNKLKLVTHCLEGRPEGNENVLKEFLTYKLYAELNPHSYRVRLAEITYLDTKGKISKLKRYAFFIEDTDEMAARAGGTECECMNPDPEILAPVDETIMAVFNYMIGNEDWDVTMLRNVKLVKPVDGSELITVPYDFDFAGTVNSSYAVPKAELGLKEITQRAYLGRPVSDEVLRMTLNLFIVKEDRFVEMINNFELLSRSSRKEMVYYITSFYELVGLLTDSGKSDLHNRLKELSDAVIKGQEVFQLR